jgi:hypothetical protein
MGKFGKMRKASSSSGGSSASNNGGILGSGIFGMFGSQVVCKGTDDTIYCNIMKMFNVLIVVIMVCLILYFIYYVLKNVVFASRKRR